MFLLAMQAHRRILTTSLAFLFIIDIFFHIEIWGVFGLFILKREFSEKKKKQKRQKIESKNKFP